MAGHSLPFQIQTQECDEWCCAAAVSSVAAFVKADQQPRQCEIVDSAAFSPNNPSPGCCDPANRCIPGMPNQACNCRGNVGIVLSNYNLTADSLGQSPTAIDFATITQQIDACSVVVIQVVDRTNPAIEHVMVIWGYGDNGSVCVADPADTGTLFTYTYSDLVTLMPSAPNNCNWRLVRLFLTIPGLCGNGG